MFRNQYDNDATTFSPQGRIHQIEYAMEAVKQGSAAVGLVSKTHVVLLALQRSPEDLASYQKKIFRIDDHFGIAIAGLASDARVLSLTMRNAALRSKMVYNRPIPVQRIVAQISDKAQLNTQRYGNRPYGVGLLVGGVDESGPHLFEFSPSGNFFEYVAMSIGARAQSAKTYLEKHFSSFSDAPLDTLITHGLRALRETLQQDKELSTANVKVAHVGVDKRSFVEVGEEQLAAFLKVLEADPKSRRAATTAAATGEVAEAGDAGEGASTAAAAMDEDDKPAPMDVE